MPVPVAPVVAPKKKGTLKAKIAEKEAERARREAAGESAEEESEIDEREQRRIDRARELDTDLINATALLGGSSIAGKYKHTTTRACKFDFVLITFNNLQVHHLPPCRASHPSTPRHPPNGMNSPVN